MMASPHFEEGEREQFFESIRKEAEADFAAGSEDAQVLVRWGGALLELAHYRQGDESTQLIEQAISKLQRALELDPSRTDAEWVLGNGYTSLGFLCPTKKKAQDLFNKASECFKRCHQRDPNNETYKKAIDMCVKAPEYYDEIQAQIKGQSSGMGLGGDEPSGEKPSSKSDFWWDVAGWVALGAVVTALVVFSKNAPPPAKA